MVIALGVVILLIVFVAQNTQGSTVTFIVWHGSAPVAVLLLIAAAAGAAVVTLVAAARILQLRTRRGTGMRRGTDGGGEAGGPSEVLR